MIGKFLAVYNREKIVIAFLDPEHTDSVQGQYKTLLVDLKPGDLEISGEAMGYIREHAYRGFNLYKVRGKKVVPRGVDELRDSEYFRFDF